MSSRARNMIDRRCRAPRREFRVGWGQPARLRFALFLSVEKLLKDLCLKTADRQDLQKPVFS